MAKKAEAPQTESRPLSDAEVATLLKGETMSEEEMDTEFDNEEAQFADQAEQDTEIADQADENVEFAQQADQAKRASDDSFVEFAPLAMSASTDGRSELTEGENNKLMVTDAAARQDPKKQVAKTNPTIEAAKRANISLPQLSGIAHTKAEIDKWPWVYVMLAERYANEPPCKITINSHSYTMERGSLIKVRQPVYEALIAAGEIKPQRQQDRHLVPTHAIKHLTDDYSGENINSLPM